MDSPSNPDMKITIGADSKPAGKSIANFQKEFNQVTDAIKKPIGEINAFVRTKKSLMETEAECARLAQKIGKTKKPTKTLSNEFERVKNKARFF